jgi:hypothetical protein
MIQKTSIIIKIYFMANTKTDNNNYGNQGNDQQRDLGAQGGPTSGLGRADGKHPISKPYDEDIQTQLAAKNKSKMKTEKNKSSL